MAKKRVVSLISKEDSKIHHFAVEDNQNDKSGEVL